MTHKVILATAILVSLVSSSVKAADAACYDAKILALEIDQVPSEIGNCGANCIVVSWPWFIDLQVTRVIEGKVPAKVVQVLAFRHTYHKPREQTLLLRKTTAGAFNTVAAEDGNTPVLCSADAAPVEPYIQPGKGQTLDDVREAGIRLYGHHTN